MVKNNSLFCGVNCLIVQDIKRFLGSGVSSTVSYPPKESNQVDHMLAKQAFLLPLLKLGWKMAPRGCFQFYKWT